MVDMINAQAGPNDLIIHLGDMCLTSTMDEYISWLAQIKCNNIWSLTGNHDNRWIELEKIRDLKGCHVNDSYIRKLWCKDMRWLGEYSEMLFMEPQQKPNVKCVRRHITLCHYPLQIWNKSHHGTWHLCGHSHGSFEETSVYNPTIKRFDCGVENALEWSKNEAVMFHYDDVKYIMNKKQTFNGDHHNTETT